MSSNPNNDFFDFSPILGQGKGEPTLRQMLDMYYRQYYKELAFKYVDAYIQAMTEESFRKLKQIMEQKNALAAQK
jgi:hypothetical protein